VSGHWEASIVQGLERIASELDAEVTRIAAENEADRRVQIAEQTRAGIELLFCVGPGFEEIVYTEAAAHPEGAFIIVPGRGRVGNVGGIEFLSDGAGYVAGVVAAHLGEAPAVGILRGSGGDWLEPLEEGFVSGFRSIQQSDEIVTVAPPDGPWELANRGVDVALYAADRIEKKVLAEAHDAGVLLVVTDVRLLEEEPEVVAAAVHLDVAESMVRVTREVRDSTFRGGTLVFDFGSGVLDVVLNTTMPATMDAPLKEAFEKARSEVTAGIVEVENLVF